MESMLTDSFISYAEHEMMAPYFASGLTAPGIMATAELVTNRVYARVLNKTYDPSLSGPQTIAGFHAGGGGVQTAVSLNPGGHLPTMKLISSQELAEFAAQPTPAQTWEKVLESQRRHINDVRVGIYDDNLRHLWSQMPLTEAQLETAYRRYAGKHYEVRQKGNLAAIVYPEDPNHLLAPMFLRRGPEGWQMDGRMYPNVVMYNYLNQWGFRSRYHPYAFAFPNYNGLLYGVRYPKMHVFAGLGWTDVLENPDGVAVYYIRPGGASERAGLEVGDLITACDDHPVVIKEQFSDCLYAHEPGEKMTLKILRGTMTGPFAVDNGPDRAIPKTVSLHPPKVLTLVETLDAMPGRFNLRIVLAVILLGFLGFKLANHWTSGGRRKFLDNQTKRGLP
jgi:hypothetical protein